MRRYTLAAMLALTLVAAWIVGQRVYLALHARVEFRYMRYCPSPAGKFPMHPCADDEDVREVIQA